MRHPDLLLGCIAASGEHDRQMHVQADFVLQISGLLGLGS
jgi:hypothetical protein